MNSERVGWYFAEQRSLEIRYDDEVPKEIHALIAPILEREMWLLPTWLQLLFVRYTVPSNDHTTLSCSPNEEYRSGTLYIHPNWLVGNDEARISEVRHEFVHFAVDVLAVTCRQVIDLHPNEEIRKIGNEQLRIAVEKAVVDLENAISRKLDDAIIKRKP